VRKKKSFGLVGIRERALMLGGEVDITSAPGHGTAIRVCFPLDNVLSES
jgi:signal transduction histidine kinase